MSSPITMCRVGYGINGVVMSWSCVRLSSVGFGLGICCVWMWLDVVMESRCVFRCGVWWLLLIFLEWSLDMVISACWLECWVGGLEVDLWGVFLGVLCGG
ncbi:hypothetical protein KC19_10G150200 [Ceratodon purpureus]|uniref:Transmembrane protein n=1 Tax=Ceratodon purpureus TaxID=3225 RepID=A0A8T0GNH1_CERPU|nr:hypothetical protein KC19_10G150200 [Ceratodon purpureus]